jgi:excisionase family DNA binding protein
MEGLSPFMSVAEATDYLRCRPQRVYNLVAEGRLTRCKDGTRLLLLREEVRALVQVGSPV